MYQTLSIAMFGNLQIAPPEESILNRSISQISNLNEFSLMKLCRRIQCDFNLGILGGEEVSLLASLYSKKKLKQNEKSHAVVCLKSHMAQEIQKPYYDFK